MVSQNVSASSPLSVDLFSMATCAAMGELSVFNAMANASAGNQEVRTAIHCKYPSKKCWNNRVEKRNGDMHKFCEYHRQKANSNQRRMEQRRKQMRTIPGSNDEQQLLHIHTTNAINHAKHILVSSPCGIDDFTTAMQFQAFANKRDMCMDVPFSPCDTVEFDIGLDAAVDCMMIDNDTDKDTDIDMEPSDLPVDLYEADLFFLEHFMTEITHSVV